MHQFFRQLQVGIGYCSSRVNNCVILGDKPTVPEPDSVTSDPVLRLDLDCEVALGVVEDNKNGIRKYMEALTFPAPGVKGDNVIY